METADILISFGLGAAWLGWLIYANSGLPRQLRSGEQPRAEKGTPEAFMLFWLDQYRYGGLTLLVAGAALVIAGLTRLL